jgi:AcrR family transcriptional regulator
MTDEPNTGTMVAEVVDAPRPPRRLRADAQRNYERLLTVTRQLVEVGGSEVSMEEVARRAGLGIGTLYRHFPTRQALLEATFLDEAIQLRAEAKRLAQADQPYEALVAWLRMQLVFGAHGQSMGAAVMSAKHREGSDIQCACRDMRESGEVLMRRAQDAGAVRPDVQLLDVLRMLHAIVMVEGSSPDDPQRAKRMFDLVLAGLQTGVAAPQHAPAD